MNKLKFFLPYMMLLIFTASCKKGDDSVEALKSEDFANVSYSTHTRNTMDVYLPEKRDRNTPVILLVHGGSWYEGDKSAFTDLAKYWRDKGYAAATMNYRYTHTAENNINPAQVNDIGKAIDFIASKSTDWQVSGDKFALQGASAGAHLSLLYIYNYDSGNKVKTVISMAGPTDLTKIQGAGVAQAQVAEWLIGSTFQANPTAYALASPITYVTAKSKPTLIFHGKLDVVVPYQQSLDLKNKLDQFNISSKLVTYEDTGHEVINLKNTASFLADCESWLKLYLK